MDPHDQPIADLIGHHLEIATSCDCARVVVMTPETVVQKLGPGVTLRIAEARLKCPGCHQRPKLSISRDWGTSEGRDNRRDPPPLPAWVVPLLER